MSKSIAASEGGQCYLLEIAESLLLSEKAAIPKFDYLLDIQEEEVTEKMREQLVCWIFELGEVLRLGMKTRELAVLYTDYVLSIIKVKKVALQLVAISAIVLAIKIEETFGYGFEHARADSGDQYAIEDIASMEIFIAEKLQWRLQLLTPNEFITVFMSFIQMEEDLFQAIKAKAESFATLCLIEYRLSFFNASEMAVAAIFCALDVSNKCKARDACMTFFTNSFGIKMDKILSCIQGIKSCLSEDSKELSPNENNTHSQDVDSNCSKSILPSEIGQEASPTNLLSHSVAGFSLDSESERLDIAEMSPCSNEQKTFSSKREKSFKIKKEKSARNRRITKKEKKKSKSVKNLVNLREC